MGPPVGRVQLLLGALATAAVALVSYFVVKRRTISGGSPTTGQKNSSGDSVSTTNEKIVSEVTVSQSYQASQDLQVDLQQKKHYTEDTDRNGSDDDKARDNVTDDSQDQTSFVLFSDNGEGAVPPGNGQNPRKSDRSSDESSYDVIDDDQLVEGDAGEDVEKDEGGHALDDVCEQRQPEHDTFLDSNETSMVIIEDLNQSSTSKSESSLYASADETVILESRLKESDEESGVKVNLVGAPEESAPVADTSNVRPFPGEVEASSSEGKYVADVPAHVDQVELSVNKDHAVDVSKQPHAELPAVQDTGRTSPTSKLEVTQPTTERSQEQFNASDVTEVLTLCQNSPSTVSKENIHALVGLLHKKIPELHSTVLNSVLRVAAFTQNVKNLRESGCLKIVADQTQEACKSVTEGEGQAEILNSLCQVLTNLTLDPKAQTEMEDTVPSLVGLLINTDSESIKLSVLRPLINFSSQPSLHNHYTQAIQDLYTLLDAGSYVIRIQSVKVLVNLSLNKDMVPYLLAAKAPGTLVELLDVPTPADLTLRTLTMLANIEAVVHKENLSPASLPVEDKAASHETMYIALHGVNNVSTLRSKVFRLTRHINEDMSVQASKLHKYLQQASE